MTPYIGYYYNREGNEVLLIGYADAKERMPFLRKDDRYKLYGKTITKMILDQKSSS
ncbi:hypothetical protein [Capnocytophaga gingivalis]|jgi:hypothetical protein